MAWQYHSSSIIPKLSILVWQFFLHLVSYHYSNFHRWKPTIIFGVFQHQVKFVKQLHFWHILEHKILWFLCRLCNIFLFFSFSKSSGMGEVIVWLCIRTWYFFSIHYHDEVWCLPRPFIRFKLTKPLCKLYSLSTFLSILTKNCVIGLINLPRNDFVKALWANS